MNLPRIREAPRTKSEALDRMKESLLESFQMLKGINRCGILFSGGVDSSLAAILTDRFCDEVILLTACAENSRDCRFVSKAADILGLNLVEIKMNTDNVWNVLPEIIHASKRWGRMDVEIAIPFFLSARDAKKRGIEDVVSGQGPDELFAGYARHVEEYLKRGKDSLQKMLLREVSKTHKTNIERDKCVISYNGVIAHFPYLSNNFKDIALSLPINWKVAPNKSPSRKIIFRELAIELGLSMELAMKPKDATQYSSGSSKVLIDSIRDHVLNYKSMSRKKANALVQDVLNYIAHKMRLPNAQITNPELEINLKHTKEFVS